MLTLTSHYVLAALIYLVRNANGQPIAGSQIARHTKIPGKYLSTILRELVRAGVLDSTRGKGGGFHMAKSPKKVRLLDAVSPFEPTLTGRVPCPFGNDECSDANPCLAHEQWKKVNEAKQRFLRNTSVYDVAIERGRASRNSKRRRAQP